MPHWMYEISLLGNPLISWIGAAIGAIVGFIVVYGATRILAARLAALASHHHARFGLQILASTFAATRRWVIALLAIAVALHALHFPAPWPHYLGWAVAILIGIQVAFWVSTLIVSWLKRATPEGSLQKTNPVIYGILTWAVEMLVWVVLALVLMSTGGVEISAFIASLGVGGIAIAMAAKNVLQDLFASLAIGLDKPFVVGDYIAFGSNAGTVTKVGIKSTRLQALSGEELAVSNSQLLQQLVHNYSRATTRRVAFSLRVRLDTPAAKAAEVTDAVNAIIDAEPTARHDRGHFMAIEADGFRYDFVYYLDTSDYTTYCDLQQAINLKILAQLDALGVHLAAPPRMVYQAS